MDQMGWTWQELIDTPPYVLRYVHDFLILRSRANASPGEGHHSVTEHHVTG